MSHPLRRHKRFVAGISTYTHTGRFGTGNGSQALIACKRHGCLWTDLREYPAVPTEQVRVALVRKGLT